MKTYGEAMGIRMDVFRAVSQVFTEHKLKSSEAGMVIAALYCAAVEDNPNRDVAIDLFPQVIRAMFEAMEALDEFKTNESPGSRNDDPASGA
jgi:propanediol dehydratase large subunit